MPTVNNLSVGETISFETIAPAILNLKYTQVEFQGLVGYSVAQGFEDIPTLHRALYPSMDQQEVRDDFRSYDYLMFTATTGPKAGRVQVLGVPWIREDTLVVAGQNNLTLLFPAITPEKKTYLFQLLKANGFTNYQVTGDE